jgi:hypothetical protein
MGIPINEKYEIQHGNQAVVAGLQGSDIARTDDLAAAKRRADRLHLAVNAEP